MNRWLLLIAVFLLLLGAVRERFTDPEECKQDGVTRDKKACVPKIIPPSLDSPVWRSRIDAEAPIGQNDEDYARVLSAFYTKVYVPSPTRPTEAQVDEFLKSPDGQVAGTDPGAMKRLIMNGFNLEKALTGKAREEKQAVTTGALAGFDPAKLEQDKKGVDETNRRKEIPYVPADTREGPVPEGVYSPIQQQEEPRNPGTWDDKSISWTRSQFFSVCPCAKNIL